MLYVWNRWAGAGQKIFCQKEPHPPLGVGGGGIFQGTTSTFYTFNYFISILLFYIWKSGEYYTGEWKDHRCHGYGENYSKNGDVYKGNWVNYKKEGQGTMTYKDGTVKSGLWKKDKFQG